MPYIRRWAESEFRLAETIFKAIIFSGVRQCGKTTLMKASLPPNAAYVSFDRADTLRAARESTAGFLMLYQAKDCLAIDEVQKVPDLFHEIKGVVDTKDQKRQFLLSGSSNYKTMPSIHESMAGRLGEVRLRPMTEGEILGNPPRFITRLLTGDFNEEITYDECNKGLILQKAVRGGFPELLIFSSEQRNYWFDAYVESSVRKDFLELTSFRKPELLRNLLELCAANSCRSLNISEISAQLGVNRITLSEYFAALQTMFLVDKIPAWQPRSADRVSTTPKMMMCDTGLMSFLTGIDTVDAVSFLNDKAKTDLVGNLIETWVYQQLVPFTDLSRDWKLYHFRNREGKEIDFILERKNGDLLCFEVKASEGIKSEHFKNLRWFREKFGQGRRIKTVVLYCGWTAQQYSEDEYALPMAYLWH